MATNHAVTAPRGLRLSATALAEEVKYRISVLYALNPADELYARTVDDIVNCTAPLTAGQQTVAQWVAELKIQNSSAARIEQVELTLRIALSQRFKQLSDECMTGIGWQLFSVNQNGTAQMAPSLNPMAMPYYDREASRTKSSMVLSPSALFQAQTSAMSAQASPRSETNGSISPTKTLQQSVDEDEGKSNGSSHPPIVVQDYTNVAAAVKSNGLVEIATHEQGVESPHTVPMFPMPTKEIASSRALQRLRAQLGQTNGVNDSSIEEQKPSMAVNDKEEVKLEATNGHVVANSHAQSDEQWLANETPTLSTTQDTAVVVHEDSRDLSEQEKSPEQTLSDGMPDKLNVQDTRNISNSKLDSSKFLRSIKGNRVSSFMHSRYRPATQTEDDATVSEGQQSWATELDVETDGIQRFSISETLPWPENLVVYAMQRAFGSGTFELYRKVVRGATNTGGYFAVFEKLPSGFRPKLCIKGAIDRAGDGGMGFFAKFERIGRSYCHLCFERHDGELCELVQQVDLSNVLPVQEAVPKAVQKVETSLLD